VANANEAAGKNMQQESAQEFMSRERHLALLTAVRVILPAECDGVVGESKQTMIGNGDAMCVASQILQDVFRSSEWEFRVHNPVVSKQRSKKLTERFWTE
jgi:hypothetical protein